MDVAFVFDISRNTLFSLHFLDCRSAILNEVQTQGSTKLPSNKSVLVLGDNATGKTTLIAKLQGVEDPKKGSGLEYAYIDVKDEYRDGRDGSQSFHSFVHLLILFINPY